MISNLMKKLYDNISAKVNFVLGSWMRNPEKNIKLFHSLVGYSLMLTAGSVSSTVIAKLITWAVLLVWTIVRSFKLSDVTHPVSAAKEKLPELAHYHAGAAVGFLVSSI